jgi:DNA-binding MarR family transcriptional regulator
MYYVRKAFDIRLNNNDPAQKLILIALASKAGCNGKSEVTPEEISVMCEITLHDTVSALRQLERKGLISKLPGFFCVYQLMF